MRVLWEWEFWSLSLTSTSVGLEGLGVVLIVVEFRVLNLRGGGQKVWDLRGFKWIGKRGDGEKESCGMMEWWVKRECFGQAFIMFLRLQEIGRAHV